jgi:hypothetical protein
MSDKKYKTIGQIGRELDDLVLLVEMLNQRIAALEEATGIESGGEGGDGVDLEVVVRP